MTVHFIGAGPGDPDLLTIRGRDLLARCPVCLHAGSTVAPAILGHARPDALLVDTATLDLDAIVEAMAAAHRDGLDIARLHSGDLALHSAVAEQCARLDALAIPWTMTPGVPAFAAAAAAVGRELTRPGVAQSLVVTRLSGRASPVPEAEQLEAFARTGATLALHLSVHRLAAIAERLAPLLGADCPVAVIERATWPEERSWTATLGTIVEATAADPPARLAIVLVGHALAGPDPDARSALYRPDYRRHRS